MYFLKLIISASYWVSGTVMIVSSLGIIILAFMNSPIQLQIALGLIGLGLFTLGLVLVKRGQDEKRDKDRFDEIIAKLDEIQQELKKEDQPKGTVAIVDVKTSGLKYYADYMTKQKEEE